MKRLTALRFTLLAVGILFIGCSSKSSAPTTPGGILGEPPAMPTTLGGPGQPNMSVQGGVAMPSPEDRMKTMIQPGAAQGPPSGAPPSVAQPPK
jgi:hypothetical protein